MAKSNNSATAIQACQSATVAVGKEKPETGCFLM